jgi:hypothetical protein
MYGASTGASAPPSGPASDGARVRAWWRRSTELLGRKPPSVDDREEDVDRLGIEPTRGTHDILRGEAECLRCLIDRTGEVARRWAPGYRCVSRRTFWAESMPVPRPWAYLGRRSSANCSRPRLPGRHSSARSPTASIGPRSAEWLALTPRERIRHMADVANGTIRTRERMRANPA